jgi:hypothetical protein
MTGHGIKAAAKRIPISLHGKGFGAVCAASPDAASGMTGVNHFNLCADVLSETEYNPPL